VTLFGYLTAMTGGRLFLEFASGKTAAVVTTVFSQNISLPLSTLCLPIFLRELFGNQGLSENFIQDYIQNHINTNNFSQEYLTEKDKFWSEPTFYVAYHYLACITNFEFFEDDKSACLNNEQSAGLLIAAGNAITQQLGKINVTTNELRQRLGQYMANLYRIEIFHKSALLPKDAKVDFNETTYIGMNQICYRVRFDEHPLQKGIGDTLVIQSTPPIPEFYNWSTTINVISGQYLYVDFDGRAMVNQDDLDFNLVVVAHFSHHLFVPVLINGEYRGLPEVNGTVRCSQSQSLDACQTACRETFIRETCECTSTNKNYPTTTNTVNAVIAPPPSLPDHTSTG
jgi:hypothetical protein